MARRYHSSRISSAEYRQWLADRALDESLRGTYQVVEAGLTESFAVNFVKAVRANTQVANEAMQALADAMVKQRMRPEDMRRAHQRIGEKAQRSVLAAYDRRPGQRDLPAYRRRARSPQNVRYAGGRLRAALRSPDFFEATPTGLNFINTERLTKEAIQWRRLNFGAGVPHRARRYNVYFGDLLLGAMGIDVGQQPGRVKLPPGRFVEPGRGPGGRTQAPGTPGSGAFYPLGELGTGARRAYRVDPQGRARRVGSRGRMPSLTIVRPQYVTIAAQNFLDAGVRRMAEEWGTEYTLLYRDYFNRMQLRARRVAMERSEARRLPAPVYFKSGWRLR